MTFALFCIITFVGSLVGSIFFAWYTNKKIPKKFKEPPYPCEEFGEAPVRRAFGKAGPRRAPKVQDDKRAWEVENEK